MKNYKSLIEIKDVPYIYLDNSMFEGNIEDISKNILEIRSKLKEAFDYRQKNTGNLPKHIPIFTNYNEYKHIKLEIESYSHYFKFSIKVYKDESDEEYNKRIQEDIQRSEKAKLASIKRKETNEKREKSLLESLKKKYE